MNRLRSYGDAVLDSRLSRVSVHEVIEYDVHTIIETEVRL